MLSFAMKQRIVHINNKKMNGNDKSKLFNNKMFNKFMTIINNNNIKINDTIKKINEKIDLNVNNNHTNVYNNLINSLTAKIDNNNKICIYSMMINGIINDLHDIVENSSPVINTPEHPFTKMKIERNLMVCSAIIPDDYESLPTINVNNNVVSGIWTDRINIGGFVDNNINEIYKLIVNNNMYEYQEKNNGTVEVKLYELNYNHVNGNVTFVRSMIIDPVNNLMTITKTWNVVLNC